MSEIDILAELQPYFSEPFTVVDEDKMDELFAVFQRDFFNAPITINGVNVKVKIHPYFNQIKDGLPAYFGGYYEKFVHIITREINGRLKISPKQRQFEIVRANRVHWIKPILEHADDARITNFRFEESDGTLRDYFWYKGKKYMVILEEIRPDYHLITGFCVDDKNFSYYQNRYNNRVR